MGNRHRKCGIRCNRRAISRLNLYLLRWKSVKLHIVGRTSSMKIICNQGFSPEYSSALIVRWDQFLNTLWPLGWTGSSPTSLPAIPSLFANLQPYLNLPWDSHQNHQASSCPFGHRNLLHYFRFVSLSFYLCIYLLYQILALHKSYINQLFFLLDVPLI